MRTECRLRQVVRELEDGDLVVAVLDDVERGVRPLRSSPSPFVEVVAADVDRLRDARLPGSIAKSFLATVCTAISVLPFGRRDDPVQVELPRHVLVVAAPAGSSSPAPAWCPVRSDLVDDGPLGVGEVDAALRRDRVVDEGRGRAVASWSSWRSTPVFASYTSAFPNRAPETQSSPWSYSIPVADRLPGAPGTITSPWPVRRSPAQIAPLPTEPT